MIEKSTESVEIQQACLDCALQSKNPTIINALEQLYVLMRLCEPDLIKMWLTIFSAETRNINREEAHRIVDDVIDSHDTHALLALDNFIDVALRRKTCGG